MYSKYGNIHRQLRALTILDFLIQNTGERFLREFADEPLLERLRISATDPVSDPLVKEKCKQLFCQWSVSYKNTPGMERVAALYKQLPKRKKPASQAKAKVLRDFEPPKEQQPLGHSVSISAGNGPSTVVGGGSKAKHKAKQEKKEKEKQEKLAQKEKRKSLGAFRSFSLEREKPQMIQTLANSSVASTNLLNALKLVNRETQRVSEDIEVMNRVDKCRELRRQVLRYIQYIETEEFLGGLIHANEELVTALMAFEVLDKSVDYDSDSDQDVLESGWSPRDDDFDESFSGLSINPPKPPRPARPVSLPVLPSASRQQGKGKGVFDDSESESETDSEDEDDDDENNPFGDRNAIPPASVDAAGRTW